MDPALLEALLAEQNRPSLVDSFIEAARDQGRLHDYSLRLPENRNGQIIVLDDDNIFTVASDLYPLYEGTMSLVEIAATIVEQNQLAPAGPDGAWQSVKLDPGQTLNIPLPEGLEIHRITTTAADVEKLAVEFTAAPYWGNPETRTDEQGIRLFERFNPAVTIEPGIVSMDMPDESGRIKIALPRLDDFAHIDALRPPADPDAGAVIATLFIVETVEEDLDAGVTPHHKIVYDYARDYADALAPSYGGYLPILSARENFYGENLEALQEMPSPLTGEYAVFNHSYAMSRKGRSNIYAGLDLKSVHFLSAGNSANKDGLETMLSAVSPQLGPRSYVIAAAHPHIGGTPQLAAYSSPGADITAPPLPLYNGERATGTSFASPMMAALGRQMLEYYGGALTPEEIMAAAFMSTDMDMIQKIGEPVIFKTNDGGRPHNPRAGAGIIDPARWQDNLDTMTAMKRTMEYQPEMISEDIFFKDLPAPAQTTDQAGRTTYSYSIPLPADMTLDRLSFVMPMQDEAPLQNVTVTSPSGFTYDIGDAAYNAHATSAFALEDVRAGDIMTITTTTPLRVDAFVQINGHGDGNVVQMLRDSLMEEGLLPQPNTIYAGATPRAETAPAPAGLQSSARPQPRPPQP